MAEEIPKYHIYQVWNSDGQYLGVLQHVSSKFILVQDINSLGPPSITIEVAQSGDTTAMPVKAITTEDGKLITTEDGTVITTEGEAPNFAVANSKIRNGNIIRITEYSSYHPNGLVVYTGKVKKWRVRLGSDDDMKIIVHPLSTDLNNYVVKSGEILFYSQTPTGATFAVYGEHATSGQRLSYQIPSPGRGMANVSSIRLRLAARSATPATVSVRIFNNYNNNPPLSGEAANYNRMNDLTQALGTATATVSSTTAGDVIFTFPNPITLHPSGVYTINVESTGTSAQGVNVHYSTTDSQATGVIVFYYGSAWQIDANSYGDLYYSLYYIPPFTKATITNFDPGATVRTFMSNYIGEGGSVSYTDSTVQATGITVPSYTFSLNSVHEGLKGMLDYAPKGFYYTVDPGTNQLTFKLMSPTPDHILIFKRHIETLDLSGSIENVKNAAYFTGGEVSGTNVFRYNDDDASIANYGVELDRLNDIHVTTNTTGDARINRHLEKHKDEEYETYVTVIDTVEDITKYKPGHTIGIRGTGLDFVDALVLPIVRIERDDVKVKLYLGRLPIREGDIINDSQEQILAIQTVANPNQPS